MFHWRTNDVVSALRDAVPGLLIGTFPPGGDHDTKRIEIEVDGAGFLLISGWVRFQLMANPDDAQVEFITVSDGLESCGGLTSLEPAMALAYGAVRAKLGALLKGTGTFIANSYHEHF